MLRSFPFIVYIVVYDRRQYLDGLVVMPRLYRVILTITQFEDRFEWSESGGFLH